MVVLGGAAVSHERSTPVGNAGIRLTLELGRPPVERERERQKRKRERKRDRDRDREKERKRRGQGVGAGQARIQKDGGFHSRREKCVFSMLGC